MQGAECTRASSLPNDAPTKRFVPAVFEDDDDEDDEDEEDEEDEYEDDEYTAAPGGGLAARMPSVGVSESEGDSDGRSLAAAAASGCELVRLSGFSTHAHDHVMWDQEAGRLVYVSGDTLVVEALDGGGQQQVQ